MATIELTDGETERIIPGDQAGREYVVTVTRGEVSFGHEKRYADQGRRYYAGDDGVLKQLGGRAIFAHGHSDSEIEIDTDGFLFDLFSNTASRRPSDEGGIVGSRSPDDAFATYRNEEELITGLADADDYLGQFPSNDAREVVESVSLAVENGDSEGVSAHLWWYHTDESVSYYTVAQSGAFGTTPDLEVPYPPEASINYEIENNSGASIDFRVTANIRQRQ